MKLKQSGRNNKYPETIITWKVDEKPIPDWIVDVCRIKGFDKEGNPILFTTNNSEGGLEFISSSNNLTILSTRSKDDFICFDPINKHLFSLSTEQLELLYKKLD